MQSQQYLVIIPQDGLCCKFTRCSKSISTIAETHLKDSFAKNASKTGFFPFFLEDVLANTQLVLYNEIDHLVNHSSRVGMRLPGERMEERRI